MTHILHEGLKFEVTSNISLPKAKSLPKVQNTYYANVIAFFPIFSLLLTERLQSINITIPKYLLNSMVRDYFLHHIMFVASVYNIIDDISCM